MPVLKAHDIELYAIHTGAFYETHKRLAREGASKQKWFEHVSGTVMHRYCREVERAIAWPSDRFDAAQLLMTYYANHIKELAD